MWHDPEMHYVFYVHFAVFIDSDIHLYFYNVANFVPSPVRAVWILSIVLNDNDGFLNLKEDNVLLIFYEYREFVFCH